MSSDMWFEFLMPCGNIPDFLNKYFALVDEWRAIVDQPTSWVARQEACLDKLVVFVDSIAAARVGQPNAPLRFYADMLRLKSLLAPHSARDKLGEIAIMHGSRLVTHWLEENAQLGANHPIDPSRHMAWQHLRATLIGEQPGFAPLDPSGRYSADVEMFLGRIIGVGDLFSAPREARTTAT